ARRPNTWSGRPFTTRARRLSASGLHILQEEPRHFRAPRSLRSTFMKREMSRKRARIIRGAIITSTALSASPAAALDLADSRLAIIHEALRPRPAIVRELLRDVAASPQSSQQQLPTWQLSIAGGPLREVAAALARATGSTIVIGADSIGAI